MTPTGPPPPVPATLVASSPAVGQVYLTWADTPNETRYEIAQDDSRTVVRSVGADVTNTLFTGLNAGISYHWYLRACNAAGCSAWYGPIGMTPTGQ
jgi:hypothetical protein